MHAINLFSKLFSSFYFSHIDKNTVLKEIKKINLNKAVEDSNIPVKIFLKKTLICVLITCISNLLIKLSCRTIKVCRFFLSLQTLQQYLSKVHEIKLKTTGKSVFCLSFKKCLKRLLVANSQINLIIFYQKLQPTTLFPYNDR